MVSIFSTKLNKLAVFITASIIMTVMQVISVAIGSAFTLFGYQNVINGVAIALFFLFGVYMVYLGLVDDDKDDEDTKGELMDEI